MGELLCGKLVHPGLSKERCNLEDGHQSPHSSKPYIEYEGPYPPVIARKSETQQILEAIAALRDGLIKRVDEQGAKLDGLSGQIRTATEQFLHTMECLRMVGERFSMMETAIKGITNLLSGPTAGNPLAISLDDRLHELNHRLVWLESKLEHVDKCALLALSCLIGEEGEPSIRAMIQAASLRSAAPKQKQRKGRRK